jgi:hypothetical protein
MRVYVPAALAMIALVSAASAEDAAYLNRFEGAFAGKGKVRTSAESNPMNVSCKVSGNATDTTINLAGTCSALAVFSRKIGADLRVAPDGTYSGTYTGSKIGPAAINGRRQGDKVVLTVNWPKPVNGDQIAIMTISNTGNGFSFAVDDETSPGGPMVRMTQINLAR